MKKSLKVIIGFGALLVVAAIVIACGIGSQNADGKWFQNGNVLTWFYSWGTEKPKADDTEKDNISLASYALDTADFAAYGISPQALEAKVITVNFEPANVTNKRIGWVCKWKHANSDWARGKNINDYVDFIPAPDYGATATLAVKQSFGEPIVVTATSRANSRLTSSSEFQYVARYDGLWDENDLYLDYEGEIDVFDNPYIPDDYTVKPTELTANVYFSLNEDLGLYVNQQYKGDIAFYFSLDNLSGVITWSDLADNLNSFYETAFAAYFFNHSNESFGEITVEMTCKYTDDFGSEIVYTFSDTRDIYFSDDCLDTMAVPPTNITTTPNGGAF